MLKKLFLVSILFFSSACSAKTASTAVIPPSTVKIDSEQTAVYAFLLSSSYQHHGYVIMDTTSTGPTGVDGTVQSLDYVQQNMHGVDSATLASFKARNDQAYPISPDMDLGNPYTLLSEAARQKIFGQNQSGWEIFYARYPQAPGITTLSRVGFNNALDQALVYLGTQSNWLVGSGNYILLKKVDGAWTVDQRVMTWIS